MLLKDKSLKIINAEIKIIDIASLEYKIDLSFLIDTAFESNKKIKQWQSSLLNNITKKSNII